MLGCDVNPIASAHEARREEDEIVPGDEDGDGVFREHDNCPELADPDALDGDADGLGDVCDACPANEDTRDEDADGSDDCVDLCPDVASTSNQDSDGDGVGDACDVCPGQADRAQRDRDRNGVGDACEPGTLPFVIEETSVDEIKRLIQAGTLTCEALVEQTLMRIQRFDLDVSQGPPLNAFVSFNERVRSQARALDTSFAKTRELVGPLHCVPLAIKDNYDSRDTPTSAGSLALLGVQAKRDGYAVGRLRAAGAILIGTTNMDELAKGVFGISTRAGRTGNAYNTARNPGGSSAGTATALAAGFAVLGTGTDNCSSLTLPAAYAGLTTIRSSFGLISLAGIFPSNRLDGVAGPMARSVRELALMLDQMAGSDANDSRTSEATRPESYLPFLKADALRGKRIGILRRVGSGENTSYPFKGASLDSLKALLDTKRVLQQLGANVIDNVSLTRLSTARSGGGFADDADAYLSKVNSPFENFAQVCDTGRFAPFTYKDADSCEAAYENSSSADSQAYQKSEHHYRDNREYVEQRLDSLELDVFLYPVDAFGPARTTAVASNCAISTVTGLPAMVIAAGHASDGMPIGMQLLGRRFSESSLLAMAYAFEQATQLRRTPILRGPPSNAVVPAFDPALASELRLAIGEASFEQVLQYGVRSDLDSETFRNIVRTELGEPDESQSPRN